MVRRTGSADRIFSSNDLIDLAATREYLWAFGSVSPTGLDIVVAAVRMMAVVSIREASEPVINGCQRSKAGEWERPNMLAGLEQRLGVGIVIAWARLAERRRNPEFANQLRYRPAFQPTVVVERRQRAIDTSIAPGRSHLSGAIVMSPAFIVAGTQAKWGARRAPAGRVSSISSTACRRSGALPIRPRRPPDHPIF